MKGYFECFYKSPRPCFLGDFPVVPFFDWEPVVVPRLVMWRCLSIVDAVRQCLGHPALGRESYVLRGRSAWLSLPLDGSSRAPG